MRVTLLLLVGWMLAGALPAWPAADVPLEFSSLEQEQRYWDLLQELRCMVCQNQSLADSHADLAQDMRDQVYGMIQSDYDNEQIIGYLVSRYGNFVRYRPPFTISTYVLWFAPLLMVLGAAVFVTLLVRRRSGKAEGEAAGREQSTEPGAL